MVFGTVIPMRKDETFITQSMLSSYMAVETKDYLELIIPFVCMCLPEKINEKIELDNIQRLLKQRYGLVIPVNVIEKILLRLCKKKKCALVKKVTNGYVVNNIYNTEDFENRTNKIKLCIDAVIHKMQKYMCKKKFLTNASYDRMKEFLAMFLDTYNYSVYEDTQSLDFVTLDKRSEAESNYYVAQFILSEYENDTIEFRYILEIIKGSLVAKSIYYFMNSENDSTKNKIQGTKFVLDTRVLIDVLGLNLPQESEAMRELLELITNNGGKLVTFDYYVEELKGIINRYAKTPELRVSLSLASFLKQRYFAFEATAYMGAVESELEGYNVDIIKTPDYDDNILAQSWHIDYAQLRDTLSKQIDYRATKGDYYSEALLNDVSTIEAVAYERGDSRHCSIFDCKCIFITKNRDICRVVHSLYKDERFKKGEVNFAMTDVDLTSIIWLSTFGENSNLPKLKLLEHAYSACAPSRAVMNEFLTRVHTLAEHNKIDQDIAMLMRAQYATVEDLSEITHNKEGSVTNEIIFELGKRMENRAEKEAEKKAAIKYGKKYQKQFEELDVKGQELDIKGQELDARGQELDARGQELITREQALENKMQEFEAKVQETKMREDSYAEKAEYVKAKQRKIVKSAKIKANKSKRIAKIALYAILALVSICIVVFFTIATWQVSNLANMKLVVAYAIVGAVSVISLILTIISIMKWFKPHISRVAEKVYDHSYSKYIKRYKELFD